MTDGFRDRLGVLLTALFYGGLYYAWAKPDLVGWVAERPDRQAFLLMAGAIGFVFFLGSLLMSGETVVKRITFNRLEQSFFRRKPDWVEYRSELREERDRVFEPDPLV